MEKQFKADPWDEFDLFWAQCRLNLEREAWYCRGFLSNIFQEEFPPDRIERELALKLRKELENDLIRAMAVPKHMMV